ncbi:hypothetical protein MASR2M78_03550 [Treponema sp.]
MLSLLQAGDTLEKASSCENYSEITKPRFFRTAYLANFLLKVEEREDRSIYADWKIGKKHWLSVGKFVGKS